MLEMFASSPVSIIILGANILLSLRALQDPVLMQKLIMRPQQVLERREWYRVLSSGFIHGSIPHLAFNMLTFYFLSLSPGMEPFLGTIPFIILYFGSLIGASVPSLIIHGKNPVYQSLGASGAISGIVMAFILILPDAPLNFFFIPIDIPAWLVGIGYIAFSFIASLRGVGRIAHDAHLFGALAGIVILVIMRPDVAARFLDWLNHAF